MSGSAGELECDLPYWVFVDALEEFVRGLELTQGLDQSLVCAAGVALASALVEVGEPQRAVDVLIPTAGGVELTLIPGVWRPRALELLTRCWLALDRRHEAAQAVTRLTEAADALQLRMADAMAARAASATALRRDDAEAAASHALAATTLHDCGAGRYRAAAEREMRALGEHVHRRTRPGQPDRTGVDSLTEREAEVAELVVDRRTNTEIADALFLSPKTVETHVRNIFHKLGVTSRVEVARVVERSHRGHPGGA